MITCIPDTKHQIIVCCYFISFIKTKFFNTALQLNILYSYAQNNITKKQMDTFIWLCVLNTTLNVYANWNCLVNGNVWYLLVPLPFALFQTYNFEEWCRLHLVNDFNKIINLSIFSR